ncbi:alpha/beta fold hydrolase [Aquimarina sp. 2304DJ70-9]|uniref:alpha/beta fold hydrolase n=1 Tax=Aquimarina penaris TaxID=3231044 RepID=UPI0034628A95
MKKIIVISFLFVFALSAWAFHIVSETAAGKTKKLELEKTIVLVHGAFADGSSWNKVVPILQKQGLKTIAVQNPLSSLRDDVDFTTRAIEEASGKVILVGHSWGGMVITEAGNHEKVESLVYVSAFAPDDNEHLHDILNTAHKVKKIPTVPGFVDPIIDNYGFIRLSEETVVKYFAPDIPKSDAKLIAAHQGKLQKDALDQKITQAAWKNKPAWFIISANDKMIAPDVMRNMAARIGAKTYELPTSHVPMLSRPKQVAKIIIEAARGSN